MNKLPRAKVKLRESQSPMKKLLFASAITAFVWLAAPLAKGADVSVDFFYNNLSGGSWLEVDPYGYCWQPDVAANDSSWRPYSDGYWAYTDDGWTWVSYEDFGWATYHYGRWARLADYGWVWVPGTDLDWGPAWVSWRTGGDHIGWAPLPPRGPGIVYEGQAIGGNVDIEFDIGPAYYNFCDVRYIGEPVLRSRIVPISENVTYINQTVNVTNITYQNNTVYNYGPDINVVDRYSSRPIQRLKLERQQNVDVNAAAKSGGMTKVQGNALVVAAPQKLTRPARPQAPPAVKAKVAQPKIEHGWSVAGDANAQNQLKEKIKTQDLKKVPPPTAAGAAAGASPVASAPPASATSPLERGQHRGKAAEQFQPGATASPAIPERGRQKGRVATPPTPPTAGAEGMTGPEGKRKGFERSNVGPTPAGARSPIENLNETRGRHEHRQPPGVTPTAPQSGGPPGAQGGPSGEGRGKRRAEAAGAPPTGVAPTAPQGGGPAGAQGGPSGEGRGKHRGEGAGAPPTGVAPTAPQGGGPAGAQGGPPGEGRGKHRAEGAGGAPPTGAGPTGTAGETKHEAKGKAQKGSPAPTP
jgi:hypothetical protein